MLQYEKYIQTTHHSIPFDTSDSFSAAVRYKVIQSQSYVNQLESLFPCVVNLPRSDDMLHMSVNTIHFGTIPSIAPRIRISRERK